MTIIKKIPRILAFIIVVVVVSSAVHAEGKRDPAKQYRVIFNCDGNAVCKDAKGDLNRWIKNLFGPLEKSHVDALFWCDGAGGNTANYKSNVLEPTGKRSGKPMPWIKKLLDEGHDPPKVVVQEAKKRGIDVFYSFRFNDIHDSFHPEEMATFKVENPQWLIGKRKYGDVTSFPSALNFAVPEVRELKFRVIEELFQKYDFDGLEIDFLRAPPYFLPGQEVKNGHLLTELLQRIRKHLDERGRQRGRPIRLAVRVSESLEACRLDGFEIPKWIDQGLVDYIVLGGGVIDIQVEQFKKIAAPKGVLVYPCLYGWPSKYYPIPRELAAGLALNYWQQKADGLYLFNWFPHSHNNSERTGSFMTGMMQQLGNPDQIRANQKQLMFVADRGRPKGYYPNGWKHCVLPQALPEDKPLQAKIRVSEKFRNDAKVTLQVEVKDLQADDVVTVTLNGQPVEGLKRNKPDRLMGTIASGTLRAGFNEAVMKLAKRSSKSAKPRTVTSLELHVTQPAQIRAKPGLFDQSAKETLGLPTLKGEHSVLYKATKKGYKFCHHSNLVVFGDRLYAMWSNGEVGEDSNGQRILGCSTTDGVNWTEPVVITEDPDGPKGPRAAVAAGFHVHADTLTAFYTSIIGGKQIDPRSTLYAITTRDGKNWGKPQKIATGFYIDGPRRMRDGRLLLNGQTADRQPRLLFTDAADGLSGWKPGVIPPNDIFSFPEPTWFQRPNGSLVMLFRTRSGHLRLYASVSHDHGKTWSPPMETNFSDATARSFAGNLPDGTAFLISNPNTTPTSTYPSIGRRTPLTTLALSADGITFDRAYVVRGESTQMRFEGKSKLEGWQYPSALAWRGWLYIAYSINKEDVGVTRVRLKQLQLQKSPQKLQSARQSLQDRSAPKLDVREIRTVSVLTPQLASKIKRMRMRYALHEGGCIIKKGDDAPSVKSGFFPRLPIERHRIYTGAGKTGNFSHNAQLAKFKNRFYLVWSTGGQNEASLGQRVMISSSDDGTHWAGARNLVASENLMHRAFGLYANDTQMVLYAAATVMELDGSSGGIGRQKTTRVDAYVTHDGKTWKKREGIIPRGIFFMEAPRPTRSGRLIAGAKLNGKLVALLWKKDDPAGPPAVVPFPKPSAPATIIGEASWYQADDGRILMWFRDERQSLRLFVAVSEDDGESWTEPMPTDFPDSMSRVRAGRLRDGRYYLIGNAYAKLMDRGHLMLALSNDGFKFDSMFSLLEEPTEQRAFGLLKVNGYQYPVAIEDEGRLLIAYSVNKEDIECAIVPLKSLGRKLSAK